MKFSLTELEDRVLAALLDGNHPVLDKLRQQRLVVTVENRELTGAGFYTNLAVPRDILPRATNRSVLRIGDVVASADNLKHGAGFMLYVQDGYLQLLEGFSYEEPWPDNVGQFAVSYESGKSRNLDQIGLD